MSGRKHSDVDIHHMNRDIVRLLRVKEWAKDSMIVSVNQIAGIATGTVRRSAHAL